MTDQPISKEERAVIEAAGDWSRARAKSPAHEYEASMLMGAVAALDRARTPPKKPKTIEERMRYAAYSTDSMHIYVPTDDAIRIAREYALEKLRECLSICKVESSWRVPGEHTEHSMGYQHGAVKCFDLIAKLIEEEGRNG